MNLLKNSRLFALTVVLAAGLFFVLQPNLDKDTDKKRTSSEHSHTRIPGSGAALNCSRR